MVTTSFHRGLSIPKRFLYLLFRCASYRRAMVNQLWDHNVFRKWFHRRKEPPHGRMFSEPACQRDVATWYMVFRGLIFASWLIIIVCSFFEIGSWEPLRAYDKWPIYLTNWDIVLGLSQAFIGLLLTTRRWKMQKTPNYDPQGITIGSVERMYWFLFVVTMNTAICVTVTYWAGVYDPKVHKLDPLNMMQHVCNTILMLIDFCVTNIPFRLRNVWWCLTIVLSYVTFSLIYYLAGGLDRFGHYCIYKILDWKKPLSTTMFCLGEAAVVTVIHSLLCILERIKYRLYAKWFDMSHIFQVEKPADIV
ncbi:protein rolling stone isoform X2 [Augochlora pura]